MQAQYVDKKLSEAKNVDIDATADMNFDNITGGVAGGGVAGVGASVATNTVKYNVSAFAHKKKWYKTTFFIPKMPNLQVDA